MSRKATDFDRIKPEAFRGYLDELFKKYPPGAKILASDKEIQGKLLKGKHKIEIPASNQSSKRLKEFESIAKKYDIEIVFEFE